VLELYLFRFHPYPEEFKDESFLFYEHLHLCALAVLGLFSYCQVHISTIHAFFLDIPLKVVELSDSQDSEFIPKMIVILEDLTCIGDMIGGSVLVFRVSDPLLGPALPCGKRRYNLRASLEDLLNT